MTRRVCMRTSTFEALRRRSAATPGGKSMAVGPARLSVRLSVSTHRERHSLESEFHFAGNTSSGDVTISTFYSAIIPH